MRQDPKAKMKVKYVPTRIAPAVICFQCGERLVDVFGRKIRGVDRLHDGNVVTMHKVCAQNYDIAFRKLTAAPPGEGDFDFQPWEKG